MKRLEEKTENPVCITVSFQDGSKLLVPKGLTLLELSAQCRHKHKYDIVAAKVDNDIKELNYELTKDCTVEFIDLAHSDGFRIYQRSACFILIKAVNDLFPERKVIIQHSISKGLYCEILGEKQLDVHEVRMIEDRMRQIVNAAIPFVKRLVPIEEAQEFFIKSGRIDRFHAIEHRPKPYVSIYSCDGFDDYLYGYMVPHTGYIKNFKLKFYKSGLILQYPERSNPSIIPAFEEQKKLFNVFSEYKRWNRILGVENVGALNDIVRAGHINEFIRIAEALHEKKIAQIADMITNSNNKKKVVLIAGPSSSGKTTFSHRLAIQLRVNGLKPVTICLDDYFVDREQTPLDENGEPDFEALEAIDVKLFNEHLNKLVNGEEVEVPIFNFSLGRREERYRKLSLDDEQILIIEGIHGLNPRLTSSVAPESKFKVYVSALTSMNIDDHNRIPSTDTRIIRRIVRDNQFRGSDALTTLKRWPSVRRGEKRNIFPYQEQADIMFNSSLIFELGVLKIYAEPLLKRIDRAYSEYSEARRLIEFLSYFLPIESREIPFNSIIREFIGGGCFN